MSRIKVLFSVSKEGKQSESEALGFDLVGVLDVMKVNLAAPA